MNNNQPFHLRCHYLLAVTAVELRSENRKKLDRSLSPYFDYL